MFSKKTFKKNYQFFTTVFIAGLFLLTSIISIGYGALNQNLNIAGQLDYEKMKIKAENLSYNNASSGSSASTAQQAIDDLYSKDIYFRFTVADVTFMGSPVDYNFKCKQGMTWDQLYNSEYNRDSLVVLGGTQDGENLYKIQGHSYIRNTDRSIVQGSQTINSTTYIIEAQSCCFSPDTLITIDFEGHTKKIKDIEVGDKILVVDIETGKKQLTTVFKDASEHPITIEFTDITLENGTKLSFNSYHPIYTTDGYKSVTNYNNYPTLKEGDHAVDFNNNESKIVKIHNYIVIKPKMTYNLLIAGIKELFLEEKYSYIANGILVHTGIAKYDDEDEWRLNNRAECKNIDLYKEFDYDHSTDKEIISFLTYLYYKNIDAYNEYIKYYMTAKQYFRYIEFAKESKLDIKNNYMKYGVLAKYDRNLKRQLKHD